MREAEPGDVDVAGRICYEAFREIAERHGFAPDFPTPGDAIGLLGHFFQLGGIWGVVAEVDGRVVGSNFMDERQRIFGIGPITVDVGGQNAGVGRKLMAAALERARDQRADGVRLVQAAYHTRSLGLYAELGFDVVEPLVTLQGPRVDAQLPGYEARPGTEEDLDACNALCVAVHGHDRAGEVRDAARGGSLRIVEHESRPVGYTTALAFFGHAVAETNEGLQALIADAEAFGGPGFLLPARNTELLRWCLAHDLRVVQLMTLMATGFYREPAGPFLPSVAF